MIPLGRQLYVSDQNLESTSNQYKYPYVAYKTRGGTPCVMQYRAGEQNRKNVFGFWSLAFLINPGHAHNSSTTTVNKLCFAAPSINESIELAIKSGRKVLVFQSADEFFTWCVSDPACRSLADPIFHQERAPYPEEEDGC